jgi:hypothetical protein
MKKASLTPLIIASSICCLCISVAAFAYWDLTRFQHIEPPLVAEPAVIDFGKIEGQHTVRGTSSIKNTTKKPLRLLHAIVSCTCNDVKLKQGKLLPGETTELQVDWDVRGRNGLTGSSLAIVYVLDNEKQQILTVNLKADVKVNVP